MSRFSLPENFTFVVLSLDPIATVEHLKDEELTEECRKLVGKKYVAFVGEREQITFWEDEPYHSHSFHIVFQGERVNDERFATGMAIPLVPNLNPTSARKPISPSLPLPWDDCRISYHFTHEARCPTVLVEKPTYIRELNSDESHRNWMFMNEDTLEYDRSVAKKMALQAPDENDSLESDTYAQPIEIGVYYQDKDDEDTDDLRSACHARPVSIASQEARLARLPVFKLSYDLSEVDQVNDPEELAKEIEVLERLREKYEDAKLEREIEAAQRVDEEHFARKIQDARTSPSPDTIAKDSNFRRFVSVLRTVFCM